MMRKASSRLDVKGPIIAKVKMISLVQAFQFGQRGNGMGSSDPRTVG